MSKVYKDVRLSESTANKQNEYRKANKFTDLILRLNDGTEFQVHKIVLISSCPYFARMFNSQMKETLQNIIDIRIDITKEYFEQLLEFIYSGKILLTELNATVMYEQGVFLELESLRQYSEMFLLELIDKSVEICLDIWRFAKKFDNYTIELRCEHFIADSATEFLDNCIQHLTIQEVVFLVHIRNRLSCTQKYLFTKLVEWIKIDYTTRQFHIYTLFNFIDFTEIPITYGFLKILKDDELRNNKDFCQILTRRYKREVEQYAELCDLPEKEAIFIIATNGILKMDIKMRNPDLGILATMKYINKQHFKFSSGYSRFNEKSNCILVTAGINDTNCGYYCNLKKTYRKFPPLNESRAYHEQISISDQIYLCGGIGVTTAATTNQFMDIYDFNSDKWIRGQGPIEKSVDFGIIQWENSSIFTFGGFSNTSLSNIVERYDPREGKWYNCDKNSCNLGLTKSICINDQIYCFNEYGFNIFNIKMNSWLDGQQQKYNNCEWWRRFHITKMNNSIYAFGWKGNQILLPIAVRYDFLNGNIIDNNCIDLVIDKDFPYKRICQVVTLKD